jgi:hypothetical protein
MMDTLEVDRAETKTEFRELLRSDRCDKCGGAAYFLAVSKAKTELQFCSHHGLEYMPVLQDQGFKIDEQTERLFGDDNLH